MPRSWGRPLSGLYIFQIDIFPIKLHLVFDKEVLLVAVLYELPECFPCLVGAVEYPFLHPQEVLDTLFISSPGLFVIRFQIDALEESHIFIDHEPERIGEQEPGIQQISRYYPIVVHAFIGLEIQDIVAVHECIHYEYRNRVWLFHDRQIMDKFERPKL